MRVRAGVDRGGVDQGCGNSVRLVGPLPGSVGYSSQAIVFGANRNCTQALAFVFPFHRVVRTVLLLVCERSSSSVAVLTSFHPHKPEIRSCHNTRESQQSHPLLGWGV